MEKAKRPRVTKAVVVKIRTGCGSAYVSITYIDDKVFECFMHLGKAGGCAIAQGEALLRSISTGLRYGVPVGEYVEQLRGISCPSRAWDEGKAVLSCADAIAQAFEAFHTYPKNIGNEEGEPEIVTPVSEEADVQKRVEELRREREKLEDDNS